jgi:hypothetical protein
MNRYLVWLTALVIFAAIIYNPGTEVPGTKRISKNIFISVYKGNAYSSVAYNNTSARVYITIEKVNAKGLHTTVWDEKFGSQYLRWYPFAENALQQNITIHNLDGKKEYLVVRYILTYNSQGSELHMQGCTIVKDRTPGKVTISI